MLSPDNPLNASNPEPKKQDLLRKGRKEGAGIVSISLGRLTPVFHGVPTTVLHGFGIKKT